MSQWDLLLMQNVSAAGTEFSEKNINLGKGGLLSQATDGTPTVLAAGANGYMLVRDDAETTGLKWVAIAAGHTQNTDTGTTNNTFTVDSDSATGKIVIDVALGAADYSMTWTNVALTGDRTITFPDATGTVALTANKLSAFAATTSAELAGVISDETGYTTGALLVFSISPSISTSLVTGSATFGLLDTTATTINAFGATTTLNLGYDGTASSTANLFNGATATGNTLTVNIGTSGAAGSTTNINLGNSSGGTVTVGKDLVVNGDLTVNGTTFTVNSTTLTVDDKNIELGSVASPTDTTADGGGITLKGSTDKTILWDNANDNWTLNQNVNIPTGFTYKINNVTVLSATQVLGVTLGTMAAAATTDYVPKTLFDAYSILYADTDNTPAALTVGASTIVGRKSSGGIAALAAADVMGILWQAAPATKTSTGTAGMIAKDSNYLYLCIATNTWIRFAGATNW